MHSAFDSRGRNSSAGQENHTLHQISLPAIPRIILDDLREEPQQDLTETEPPANAVRLYLVLQGLTGREKISINTTET